MTKVVDCHTCPQQARNDAKRQIAPFVSGSLTITHPIPVVIVVFLSLFVLTASGLEIRGRVTSIWEKNSFTIETRSDETVLWFDLPSNTRIIAQAEASDSPIKRVRVKMNEPFILTGMKEWRITIFWDSVDCNWGCRLVKGEEPVLNRVQGYASTDFAFNWSLVTEEDVETWNFAYPKDATFIVRWKAAGARGAEEQDLSDDTKVKLIGTGIFNIEVDPVDGEGEFTAERVK